VRHIMYIPDLFRLKHLDEPLCLTVGWLDATHPYPQGTPAALFIERFWAFCDAPVHPTFGIHDCELCEPPTTVYQVQRGDETIYLGTAEIRVFGSDAKVYAAPTLIYHYVVDHNYLPPAEFIQAVLVGPLPNSAEYQALTVAFDNESG
jgi:hypothetical protein